MTRMRVVASATADFEPLASFTVFRQYSRQLEIAVVRKHRTDSGLIRYDPRRDIEGAQAAREMLAAEKPKFIVMMIGNNDRQSIREKAVEPRHSASAPSIRRFSE